MKTKILILTCLSLLLASCGISYTPFATDKFTLEVPEEWQAVVPKENSGVDVDALFVLLDSEGNVLLNFNVIHKDFTSEVVLEDFINANMTEASLSQDYREIDQESLRAGKIKTKLLIFTATDKQTGDQRQFLQTYFTQGKRGYILTSTTGINPSSDLTNQAKKVMRSFIMKEIPVE